MTRKLSIVSTKLREPPERRPAAAPASAPAAVVVPQLAAPEDCAADYRAQWDQFVAAAPHLGEADRHMLSCLVDAVLLHREAASQVRQIGALIKSTKGVPMQNPYLAIQNKQAAIIARYSDALGLSVAARSRGKGKGNNKPAGPKAFSAFARLKDPSAFR